MYFRTILIYAVNWSNVFSKTLYYLSFYQYTGDDYASICFFTFFLVASIWAIKNYYSWYTE